jgi:hypothetical protein
MRLHSILVGVAIAMLGGTHVSATVRITEDAGGSIGQYAAHFATLRDSREQVVIDGLCFSACTMVLSLVPRERICVTRNALLGFHEAYYPGGAGNNVTSLGDTVALMSGYPPNIRNWIMRNGGLSSKMIFLHGRELTAMYKLCR